jgi:dGTP triphosphohydrolase
VYSTEDQEFSWVKEPYSLKNDRSPEAELMDWADDIAYAVHDMDDFYRAGLVPIDRLAKDMEELDEFLDHAVARQRGKTRYTDSELREAGFNAIGVSLFPNLIRADEVNDLCYALTRRSSLANTYGLLSL